MPDCSCLIIDDFDGPWPEFYSQKIHKARKEYICCECGDKIFSGQTYERVFGKWNGEAVEYKTCKDCLSIRDNLFCGYYHGGIWEEINEVLEYNECLSEIIPKLTEGARFKLEKVLTKKAEQGKENT
jgi:hypothetical protein